MKGTDVLDIIDRLVRETAEAANVMAAAASGMLDATGAAKGIAVRLQAFEDLRREVVIAGLREHEAAGVSGEETPPAPEASAFTTKDGAG